MPEDSGKSRGSGAERGGKLGAELELIRDISRKTRERATSRGEGEVKCGLNSLG